MAHESVYPEEMRESIEKVEETRDRRLKEAFRRITPEEKDELLRKWHPDFRPEGKRPLKIGPSKGLVVPHEVADLIEAYPLIDPSQIDLSRIDYDVDILIIGGGGAGASAALWAHNSGIPAERILIATKLRFGDANTKMAQGGIQAADRPNDSPILHFIDVMGGGHYANKPELVKTLVENAPFIIKWLEDLGVMFDKDEEGNMIELPGGGTCRKRLHACKDYTGLEIMRVLMDEVLNRGIKVIEFSPAIELLTDPDTGRVTGAVLWNLETKEYYIARGKAVILTTGGFGRLHIQNFPTTNHYGATMDGVVMAYRVGARLRDLDATQYHPTGAAYPEQIVGLLVTEKVRGLGAQLVNVDGEQFIYPLEPRDVVAAAIIRECYGRNKGVVTPTGMRGVWLDTPMIEIIHGEGTIKKSLAAIYRMFSRFGIDPTKEPILVFPTLHYMNGGVEINVNAQVLNAKGEPIPGFFAAGEVCGGVHGKNRLMGNSLLEITVFGRIAGISAAKYVQNVEPGKLSLKHIERYVEMLKEAKIPETRKSPMILPEYRGEKVLSRAISLFKL
ncbi:MAG: succinate dehydrogenase/fumarate reductase flavoprotein subunit [Candidatus Methanomethylicota archaeon]|uniref:Succinate dehydrogenase/fumarate reductase flavoprotein subunit n=1 Tax=Thermoproteota archaeon TaxID=2056631 RepID=A0A497F322_9CREN|nr:MAG: succinate dehydrogenase/fumarate reductase flavoprotein subunit [Candidatus Verstraetearchaeota archaeon]